MIEKLGQLELAIDELVKYVQKEHNLKAEPVCNTNFLNLVKLDTVTNPKFIKAAKQYIDFLIGDVLRYGYLYYLWHKNLSIPLDIHFNAETVIESKHYDKVIMALNELARQWGMESTKIYEITRLELLYFFLLILNPKYNWISIDYIVGGAKDHAHLIAAPSRLLRNRKKTLTHCNL